MTAHRTSFYATPSPLRPPPTPSDPLRPPLPSGPSSATCPPSPAVAPPPPLLPPLPPPGAFCADGMASNGDEDSCLLLPEWAIRSGPRRTTYHNPKEVRGRREGGVEGGDGGGGEDWEEGRDKSPCTVPRPDLCCAPTHWSLPPLQHPDTCAPALTPPLNHRGLARRSSPPS